MQIHLKRLNDHVHFEATNTDGNTVLFDGSPQIGGQNLGVRPMESLLMSLAACSSIDVVSILKKQKIELTDLQVHVTAERDASKVPSLFKSIDVAFLLEGNLPEAKAQRAVQLSFEKYCSVAKTLEPTSALTYSVTLNGLRI